MTRRTTLGATPRERIGSAAAVAVVTGGLGWLLASALALHVPHTITRALTAFDVLPPPPPPPPDRPPPPRHVADRARQAPAPAGKRAVPTPIVAPKPVVVLPVPPVVATAPVAGIGAATSAGAADFGSGTGAGGQGNGRGGGGDGDGGAGPRQLNELPRHFLPPAARALNGTFVVGMRFTVQSNGRVSDCVVIRSSGRPDLDEQTCALIVAKLRYAPAHDASGRKMATVIDDAEQRWEITHGTGEDGDE